MAPDAIESTLGPCIADAAKNFLTVLLAERTDAAEQLSPPQLQACARALLQAVNAAPLPDGFAAVAGVKATRAFGRALLSASGHWDIVVGLASADQPGGAVHGLDGFLHGFGRSFVDGVVERHEVELGELVWASDFTAALRERGVKRRARAQEQAAEAEASAGSADHGELKELVEAQLGRVAE